MTLTDRPAAPAMDEIVASLRRMGLVSPTELPDLHPLTGGVSSQIVRVQTKSQVFCVKRALARLNVAADWTAPLERNRTEMQWLKLAAAIVPGCVPRVLAEDPAQHLFAMEYFDPQDFGVWKARLLMGRAEVRVASAVAAMLGALHRATAGNEAVAKSFANEAAFEALRLEPYLNEVARVHSDLASQLARLAQRTRKMSVALIHGDVSPKNILVGDHRIVLLDAECATYGDPAFDVAFCLTHLLLKAIHRPADARGYALCFRQLATDYLREVTWELPADLELRAVTLLPALLLARVDGKSPVEYLRHEKVRQRVRAFARRFVCDPPQRPVQLIDSWLQERELWT